MIPSRAVRSGWWLAGLLVLLVAPLRADSGFSTTLSTEQRKAAGLDQLSASDLAMLDLLVASDVANARQLRVSTLDERFSLRHTGQDAALDHLSPDQVAQLDELVAGLIAAQPFPKERPRLKDNEVVSLQKRLEVHGGMSFTVGWASGSRNFREAGAWVSYFDPATGLGLALGISQYSGDAIYPYGYYYPGAYYPGGWYGGVPGTTYGAEVSWSRPNFSLALGFSQTDFSHQSGFDGSGAGLRGPPNHHF